jgi:hypothetical protein
MKSENDMSSLTKSGKGEALGEYRYGQGAADIDHVLTPLSDSLISAVGSSG